MELKPLDRTGLSYAFRKFFGLEAPAEITRLRNLTPGDFSVVRKQMWFNKNPSVEDIASALMKESRLKPEAGLSIGFV